MNRIVERLDKLDRRMHRVTDRWWWVIPIVFVAVAWHEGWL